MRSYQLEGHDGEHNMGNCKPHLQARARRVVIACRRSERLRCIRSAQDRSARPSSASRPRSSTPSSAASHASSAAANTRPSNAGPLQVETMISAGLSMPVAQSRVRSEEQGHMLGSLQVLVLRFERDICSA